MCSELELPNASFGGSAISREQPNSPRRPVALRTGLAAGVPLSDYALHLRADLPGHGSCPLPAVTSRRLRLRPPKADASPVTSST